MFPARKLLAAAPLFALRASQPFFCTLQFVAAPRSSSRLLSTSSHDASASVEATSDADAHLDRQALLTELAQLRRENRELRLQRQELIQLQRLRRQREDEARAREEAKKARQTQSEADRVARLKVQALRHVPPQQRRKEEIKLECYQLLHALVRKLESRLQHKMQAWHWLDAYYDQDADANNHGLLQRLWSELRRQRFEGQVQPEVQAAWDDFWLQCQNAGFQDVDSLFFAADRIRAKAPRSSEFDRHTYLHEIIPMTRRDVLDSVAILRQRAGNKKSVEGIQRLVQVALDYEVVDRDRPFASHADGSSPA